MKNKAYDKNCTSIKARTVMGSLLSLAKCGFAIEVYQNWWERGNQKGAVSYIRIEILDSELVKGLRCAD